MAPIGAPNDSGASALSHPFLFWGVGGGGRVSLLKQTDI